MIVPSDDSQNWFFFFVIFSFFKKNLILNSTVDEIRNINPDNLDSIQQNQNQNQILKDEKAENQSSDTKDVSKNGYLCAFCHFIFSTKSGYMEHTKMGNCIQVSNIFVFKWVWEPVKKIFRWFLILKRFGYLILYSYF